MIVGIDFGTSNSLVALIQSDCGEVPLLFTDRGIPHPSMLWFHGDAVEAGGRAKERLQQKDAAFPGEVFKSPKLDLGKSRLTRVGAEERTPTELAAHLLSFLRVDAAKRHERGVFTEAVITIPVTMHGPGRRALREAASTAGIQVVQFVHEPLAALYAYFRKQPGREAELARLNLATVLVFDWGGGTLDMTLVNIRNGNLCQILNRGLDDVGGDVFDKALAKFVQGSFLANPDNQGATISAAKEQILLDRCEKAKITLSSQPQATIFIDDFARVGDQPLNLYITVTAKDFQTATAGLIQRGVAELHNLLNQANLPPSAIELCLATGGMALMPAIHHALLEVFSVARVPDPAQAGAATLIAEGAAWIAHDNAPLTLAKSLELEMANNRFMPLLKEGLPLPQRNQRSEPIPYDLYCTDPTDGTAKFVITRPTWPGHASPMDARRPYIELFLGVDQGVMGMFQRLRLELQVDSDLIVTAIATAIGPEYLPQKSTKEEIHDLEFGIQMGIGGQPSTQPGAKIHEWRPTRPIPKKGEVRLKANVSDRERNWYDVPGDVVERFNGTHFRLNNIGAGNFETQTALWNQQLERDYYRPFVSGPR